MQWSRLTLKESVWRVCKGKWGESEMMGSLQLLDSSTDEVGNRPVI